MIKKIKQWLKARKHDMPKIGTDGYTREQLERAYLLGYNDGKSDGLAIARDQATKSLKEILQWQNQKK